MLRIVTIFRTFTSWIIATSVRFLKWDNIDFEKKVIEFSKDEMKAREVFRLPLTETTYEILQEVKKYNSGYKYVFSSVLSKNKMLSENTLGYALKRMGLTSKQYW